MTNVTLDSIIHEPGKMQYLKTSLFWKGNVRNAYLISYNDMDLHSLMRFTLIVDILRGWVFVNLVLFTYPCFIDTQSPWSSTNLLVVSFTFHVAIVCSPKPFEVIATETFTSILQASKWIMLHKGKRLVKLMH